MIESTSGVGSIPKNNFSFNIDWKSSASSKVDEKVSSFCNDDANVSSSMSSFKTCSVVLLKLLCVLESVDEGNRRGNAFHCNESVIKDDATRIFRIRDRYILDGGFQK